ncbi:hypothetical protein BV25DRAFT_1857529 [Artomyces pyxidatus]|uniref:Uncharacterized protein n=1 Tax=Artomyces pyxidatus TaxID=48021 RepID=A0ACB8SZM7_9AGAM|nr:hypothetical protein BV25DRAFT_1857529 [Artomyces pyxidatus]
MALRVIKKRTTGSVGLDMVVMTAQMASNVTNMLQFPPAAAAASLVLTIIQMVADIKTNQNDCYALARRAARLLTDLGRRMEGKWDDAPQALIENIHQFEMTLISIRDFMRRASEAKWLNRLMSKTSIEQSLNDFSLLLDEASQSFQIASLIEIHYAISTLQRASTGGSLQLVESPTSMASVADTAELFTVTSRSSTMVSDPQSVEDLQASVDSAVSSVDIIEEDEAQPEPPPIPVPTEEEEFLASIAEPEDEFGFRRYHQSDVIIRKANRKAVGWFSGTADAQANGQKMTIKRYEGPKGQAVRQWMKDIKLLRNLYHENLPQILGYSDGKSQTPFILLASVPNRDISGYVQTALKSQGVAGSASMILKLYRDITSAVLHIQQQMSYDDSQAQDFIEGATYTVDSDNNVVLGLPTPKDGWMTARSYNLAESLVDRAMKYLKEVERTEGPASAHKYRQLQALLQSLLPRRSDGPTLLSDIEDMLDEDEPISLAQLRKLSLEQQRHDQAWHERAPLGKCALGDFGHIPSGTRNFEDFVRLGNFLELGDPMLDSFQETTGTQVQWVNGFTERQQASPFPLPGDLEGWPIALLPQSSVTMFVHHEGRLASVNDAWKYLLEKAQSLAKTHGVEPQDILLITRSLRIDDYTVKDWSPPPPVFPQHGHPQFGGNNRFPGANNRFPGANVGHGFGGGGFGFQNATPIPSLIYLFTSWRHDVQGYITDNPMGRPRPREYRSTSWCYACSGGVPVAYVDYIQLDAEDFRDC